MAGDEYRTFIAVEVPDGAKEAIRRAVEPVRGRHRDAALGWTAPRGWHLTLKFLGEIGRAEVERTIAATTEVAAEAPRFTVVLGGWGAFPAELRPRVLWLGLREGAEPLGKAAERLDARLAADGFAREDRPFHPHLTIVRVKNPRPGVAAFADLRTCEIGEGARPFAVERIIVFRSTLRPSGAEYAPLAECALGG